MFPPQKKQMCLCVYKNIFLIFTQLLGNLIHHSVSLLFLIKYTLVIPVHRNLAPKQVEDSVFV